MGSRKKRKWEVGSGKWEVGSDYDWPMRIRVVGSVFAVPPSAGALASLGVSALEPVVLIPIDGEGSKDGSRWRGPSGQGAVTGTDYVDAWSDLLT